MRVAVVGGGSTYTPELIDGFARLSTVDEVVLIDPAAERLGIIGGFGRRIFARYGHPGELAWTDDLDAGPHRRRRGADPAAGRRAADADQRRDVPTGVRLRRAGDDRRRRAREGAAHGPGRARHRPPRTGTRPAGRVDRGLHQPGRHRHPGAARRRTPRGRAVQRRDRSPAGAGEAARRGTGRRDARPRRAQPPDVGARGHRGRCGPAAGADRQARRLPRPSTLELPGELLLLTGTLPSYYLRYFYCHDEVVAEQRAAPARGARVAEIERELLAMYRDPTLDTKPELLSERGGAFYSEAATRAAGVAARHARHARGERPQRRHAAEPAGRRGRRGVLPGRRRRGHPAADRAARAPTSRGSCRTCPATRSWPSTPRCAVARTGCSARCSRIPSWARWTGRGAHRPVAGGQLRVPCVGAMSLLLAVDGGNSKTEVLVCDDTGAVLGYARGPGTNHQTVGGVDVAMRRLDRAGRAWPATDAGLAGHGPDRARRRLPRRRGPAGRADHAHRRGDRGGLGRQVHCGQRHARAAAGRHRAGGRGGGRVRLPASTASAAPRTAARSGSRHSARSPATGAAATSWARSRCGTRRARRTAAARRPRSRGAVAAHFGLGTAAEVAAAAHLDPTVVATRLGELTPVLFRGGARDGDDGGTFGGGPAGRGGGAARDRGAAPPRPGRPSRDRGVSAAACCAAGTRCCTRWSASGWPSAAPLAECTVATDPPVVGAALLGLDALGATPGAEGLLRTWSSP